MFGLGRPSAQEAAGRALILRAVVGKSYEVPLRGEMPALLESMSEAEREAFRLQAREDRRAWGEVLGPLQESLSPLERAYFKTDALSMTERQHIDGTYRIQAFCVLAWALFSVKALPPYDVGVDDDLMENVPGGYFDDFIRNARLRPRAEINAAREIAELWNWRSRTRQLQEQGIEPPAQLRRRGLNTLDDIVRMTAKQAAERGDLTIIDEDFPTFGKAYRDLSWEEWTRVNSITMERHFTLNWLCGMAPGNRWDETPTET